MLQSKFTNSLKNKMKNDDWKEITSSVNALGVEMRGVEEIRKKWNNLCSSAKLAYHEIHKERQKTGGTPPPDLSEETAHIVDMMKDKSSFVGIDHGIDSFNNNVETHEEEGSTENYGIVTPTPESSGIVENLERNSQNFKFIRTRLNN